MVTTNYNNDATYDMNAEVATNPARISQNPIYIGIAESDRQAIAEGLNEILADTYTLYLKTHFFHWNVTGPLFQSLHNLFEKQYREMAEAIDQIAERIRALGFPAGGTFATYQRLSAIREVEGVPAAEDMLDQLVEANETVSRRAKPVLTLAASAGDEPTVDLLTNRMRQHEENAWMLRSHLA